MTNNNLLTEQLNYMGEHNHPTKVNLYSYNKDCVTYNYDTDSEQIKESTLNKNEINWIQVTGLQNTKLVKDICQTFNIDFLTTQDILNPNHLPKIEEHDDYNVIILKLLGRDNDNDYEPIHMCMIQGKSFILTFSENESDIFNDIISALDKNTLKIRQKQSDYLLSVILNGVISSYMSILNKMEDELEDVEESLIIPNSSSILGIENIQQYRKNYRIIKKCIFPMKEHISKLFHEDNELLNESQRPFFSDINDHLMFVLQTMENCRDLITAIVDLYISKNDQRLNDIMKQLTIVSTIFIPLTFLAGIWGMNFEWMPELNWKYGYLMAWGLMLGIGIALYLFFKHKKW